MFATLAAAYAREPRAGEPDVLTDADRRLSAGELDADGHQAITREFGLVVLAEQESAGLGVLTDGAVAHEDRLQELVHGFGGTSGDSVVTLPDGSMARSPRFEKAPAWTGPITVDQWRWADETTDQLVKQVVIGPYTIARLAETGGARREVLALGLAEALNLEIRALAAAGCPLVQVDEGALTSLGADDAEWALYAETQRRLTEGLDDLHLSLGLYAGAVPAAGHASILGGPYRSYLVDALAGPDTWRFIAAIPAEMGVVVGAADAADPSRDETEVMVWAAAWAGAGGRGAERIGLAPNGSLRGVGRHAARRKIERMGEAVGIASMGPLDEVADSLDPIPLESKMAPLRRLAEAVEAARSSA